MVGFIFGIIFLLAGIGVGIFLLCKTETVSFVDKKTAAPYKRCIRLLDF